MSCICPVISALHSCDLHTSQSHFLVTSETGSYLQAFFPCLKSEIERFSVKFATDFWLGFEESWVVTHCFHLVQTWLFLQHDSDLSVCVL